MGVLFLLQTIPTLQEMRDAGVSGPIVSAAVFLIIALAAVGYVITHLDKFMKNRDEAMAESRTGFSAALDKMQARYDQSLTQRDEVIRQMSTAFERMVERIEKDSAEREKSILVEVQHLRGEISILHGAVQGLTSRIDKK